ncbi:MAG: ABC transporter substrate-binding protein, partial [Bacteroidetes bacterium]
FVTNFLPKAKLIAAKNYDEAVKLVMEDKAAAMVSDAEIIAVTMMRYPNSDLTALSEPLTIEPIGMALPTNDYLFLNLVENFFAELQMTGLLEQLQANWFDNGNWLLQMK